MKVIKTVNELMTAFTEDTPMPASVMKTEGIFNYTFKSIWTFEKNLMPGQW